jgi:uncharacterized protein (DUF1697 family)
MLKTFIALLRGINVSGKNMIKMNDLVVHLENLGFKKIRTYIQSGNIIFETEAQDKTLIQKSIHEKIKDVYGFDVPTLVRSAVELKLVFKNNPFINEHHIDIDKLHVTFLNDIPAKENVAKLSEFRGLEDQFILKDDVVYICCENGYGRTKLNNTFFENKLKVSATTRNWKTVGKLVDMAYTL